jgi:hypothetical protein
LKTLASRARPPASPGALRALNIQPGLHAPPDGVLAPFPTVPYRPAMPDTPHIHPATPDEIAETLSFALRYEGRMRVHHADDTMARITADRLVRHLGRSGFVVMKRPPAPLHSAPYPPPAPPGPPSCSEEC